jgi:hypothetical protein
MLLQTLTASMALEVENVEADKGHIQHGRSELEAADSEEGAMTGKRERRNLSHECSLQITALMSRYPLLPFNND